MLQRSDPVVLLSTPPTLSTRHQTGVTKLVAVLFSIKIPDDMKTVCESGLRPDLLWSNRCPAGTTAMWTALDTQIM